MPFKDEYDFENLVNESERFVIQELERQLDLEENQGVCRCQECVLDMAAFALNNVKPVYRVSLLGSLYAGAMEQGGYADKAREAVKRAVEQVKANPAH